MKDEREWPYLGCMVAGYPTLHPLDEGYWDRFWKIRAAMVDARCALLWRDVFGVLTLRVEENVIFPSRVSKHAPKPRRHADACLYM